MNFSEVNGMELNWSEVEWTEVNWTERNWAFLWAETKTYILTCIIRLQFSAVNAISWIETAFSGYECIVYTVSGYMWERKLNDPPWPNLRLQARFEASDRYNNNNNAHSHTHTRTRYKQWNRSTVLVRCGSQNSLSACSYDGRRHSCREKVCKNWVKRVFWICFHTNKNIVFTETKSHFKVFFLKQ